MKSNIFLPAHLISAQKELLYKKKNHLLLTDTEQPATVRLANEIHPLKPLDKTKDEPGTRKTVYNITKMMSDCGDWRPLAPFLEEIRIAKRRIDSGMIQRIVRKAGEGGQQEPVLDVLRRVERTGVGLWDVEVAREVAWAGLEIAVQGEWGEKALKKAVVYAKVVEEMLFEQRHDRKRPGWMHPRSKPEVLAVLVLLRAALLLKYPEAEAAAESGKEVERLAGLMLKGLEGSGTEMRFEGDDWVRANYLLCIWAPVWHASRLASRIMGAEAPVARSLAEKMDTDLRPLIENCEATIKRHGSGKPRRGLNMLRDLEGAYTLSNAGL